MSAKLNFTVAMLALALVASGGVATYALRERGKSRDANAAVLRERDDLLQKLKKSEQVVSTANERLAQARLHAESLKEDLGRLFPQKSSAAAPSPPPSATATPALSATTPAVRSMAPTNEIRSGGSMFVAGRYRGPRTSFVRNPPSLRTLDTLYPALYRQLKLSPDQAAQFKVLAIEVAERFSDLDRRARSEQKRPSDPTMQPLYAAVDAEYRKKLVDLIGADAIPAVEHFAETLVFREAVVHVAGELFYTHTPLQESQADRLVEIMSKNIRDPSGRIDTVFGDASAMKAGAREFLSPAQLTAWEQFIDDLARTNFGVLQPRPGSGMTTR
jgi:hypothetical protein